MELCLEVKKQSRVIFDEMKTDNQSDDDPPIFMGKSDVQSAFCLISLSMMSWAWLIMSAINPKTKRWQYFVDKCLPFGASISCAIFQRFSNAIRHITQFKTGQRSLSNYLDNFLFIAYARTLCNEMIQKFLNICNDIAVPIAMDKTEWASIRIIFLGILLDSKRMVLAIPEEKRIRAINLLKRFIDKRKTTVKELQSLCGYLNFLNRAIHPGRVFMRRMYAKYTTMWTDKHVLDGKADKQLNSQNKDKSWKILKPYHHVRLDSKFKADYQIWLSFLTDEQLYKIVNRPMLDLNMFATSQQLNLKLL